MMILIVTACATPQHRPTSRNPWTASRRAEPDHATVWVSNHNWSDAVVYLVSDGFRVRLGNVTSARRVRFQVKKRLLDAIDVRLYARFIGPSEDYLTGKVALAPGGSMTLELENYLPQSVYWVGG
jgi:hypothetical protein